MPSADHAGGVESPWGELSFEAVRKASSASSAHSGGRGESHVSPAYTSNGRKRASRAAQFMPFAALTGYYELIREQELLAQQRAEKDRERWEDAP